MPVGCPRVPPGLPLDSILSTRGCVGVCTTQPDLPLSAGMCRHLLRAAVSNSSSNGGGGSSGSSSDGGGGSGSGASAAAQAGTGDEVKGADLAPVVTVDQLLSMYSWQYVDVLKVGSAGQGSNTGGSEAAPTD